MLALSRKRLQSIVFPTLGIRVQVIEFRGDKVRLGIELPDDVPVWREELIADLSPEELAGGPKRVRDTS
jgi:carbon storage regulator